MKNRPTTTPSARLLLAAMLAAGATQSIHAASQTWVAAPADANWVTATNWGTAAPGATSGVTSDIATFNTAIPGSNIGGSLSPIVIDSGRRIGGISFGTNAGAYVIGSNAGNTLTLSNTGGGSGYGSRSIIITSNATSSQTIAAPLAFVAASSTNGQFGFVNNASSNSTILTLSGAINGGAGGSRPGVMVLDGSNTGNNEISGAISSTTTSGQAVPWMIKRGTGTWIISGANTVTGTPATNTGGSTGFQILDGLLIAKNSAAFGTSGTANTNQVYVGNKSLTYTVFGTGPVTQTYSSVTGGTLEIANGITIDNGVSLNLHNAGTIRGQGTSGTNGRINLNTATGTVATISAVGASDVFTIGNGSNDLTGGSADTVINVGGLGTVINAQSSTGYLGQWAIDTGTLKNGSSTNGLGVNGVVTFTNGSTGKLQLGNSLGLSSLTTNASSPTAGIVETGAAGSQTLSLANSSTNTFGGTLRDGTGVLVLSKSGAGTLTLSGNSNTYSGGTTVSGGTLNVTNTSGSATGSGNVTLGAATLTGSGIISGVVTTGATSIITPGTVSAGNAGSGTLSLGGLTLISGTTVNFGLNASNSTANTISAGALTLPGSGSVTLNLFTPGTAIAFASAGTYDLFSYTTLSGGAVTSAFSIGTSIAGYTASFGTSGGYVQLTLAAAGTIGSWTNANATGNWSEAGNWSGGVPGAAGDSASFTSAPGTITLDANKTVGGLTLGNASAYTLTGSNTLTIDNNGGGATVDITAGSHLVETAIALNENVAINTASGTQLSVSGPISEASGSHSLTKSGTGTLVLSGNNTYTGGTAVNAGVLEFNSLSALGAGTTLDLGSTLNGGTLKYASGNTADISSLTVTFNAGGATLDTNGNNVTLANAVGNGGAGSLTKTGSGTLTLGGNNTYTGTTTINAGAVSISSNHNLGAPATGAGLTINGGTLASTATFALDNAGSNARAVTIGTAGAGVDVAASTTLTVTGAVTGSTGGLTKSGDGVLVLSANNSGTLSSAINVTAGTLRAGGLQANGTAGLGTGAITLGNGTTLASNGVGATENGTSYGNLINAINVASGNTATLLLAKRMTISSTLTGAGTLNVAVDSNRQDYQGNWGGFTGQINLTGAGEFRIANFQNSVFNNSSLNIGAGVNVLQFFNPPSGSGTETVQNIGALSGDSGSFLSGNPVGGRFVNWTVGSRNSDTTFAGIIQDTSGAGQAKLTKVGNGTLTLSGNNTFTGATTVSSGTLRVDGTLASGSAVTVSSGARLSGNGTIGGNTTLNSATIGSSGDTLTLSNNLTTNGASSLASGATVNVNGTTTVASGNFTVNGTLGGSGIIGGAGSILVSSTGILAGNVTANSATTINGGTLGSSGNTLTLGSTLNATGGSIAAGATVNVTGATSFDSGTFTVNGTLGGAGTKSVAFGATLKGSGTIIGNTTINGNLAPGNSPGVLTFDGDLTFTNTTVTTMELAGTGGVAGTDFDQTVVTGTLTFDGALNIISYLSFSIDQPGTYDLFAAATAGNFDSVSVGSTALSDPGLSGLWTANNVDNTYLYTFDASTGDFSVQAIPEPSAYAALAGLGMIGFALTRRRRHQTKRAA